MGFIEEVTIEMEKQSVSVVELATCADTPILSMLQILEGRRTPRRNEIRDIKNLLGIK